MIITNEDSVGGILQLCQEKRARRKISVSSPTRVMLTYELPLNEIVLDFTDRLKSTSAATPRSITTSRLQRIRLIKLDVLVAGERSTR